MPTKKELADLISINTHPTYDIALTKPRYKQSEANLILVNAMISYRTLCMVDQIKADLLKDTPCMSTKYIKDTIKQIWKDNPSLRSHADQEVITRLAAYLDGTTIGRNQLIEHLIQAIKDSKL